MMWFVEVRGDCGSVLDLELLAPEVRFELVDPSWVNDAVDNRLSVTSDAWNAEADPKLVREHAHKMVATLNERLLLDSALHDPIEVGAWVWREAPELPSGFTRSAFIEVQCVALVIAEGSATMTVNGYEAAPPRTVGLRQKELGRSNPNFGAAVSVFVAAGDDIRQLYIAFDYVRKRSGHKPHKFASKAEIAAFCETADNRPHVRHIGGDRVNDYPEMQPAEARALVRRLLRGWLDAELPY